ncbi:MAG: hypothetical protein JNL82_15325 [Myxococcales bacterium]|nr:hypothetical protein [Myxococcales bacterium]
MPTSASVAADESGSSSSSSSTSGLPSDDSTSTSGGSSTSSGAHDGGSTSVDIPDFGPTDPPGCEGKIDFLFVISAGGTMKNDQDKLLASFPGFIDAIEQQLPDFDVHILSANTNQSIDLDDCSVCTDSCDPQGDPPYCGAMFNACDKKPGAGVVFPTGMYASNRRCDLDSGLRYITNGQQDLKEAFACVAQVGIAGGGITGEAMTVALQPDINNPDDADACNRGFLRDDALLVVTIIQDDYDEKSLGTVEEWIEALRAAKKYDDDAFMVMVLTTDVDVGFDQLCLPDQWNQTKNRLRLLAEGVKHGFIDSICLDDYAPFFAEHVAHLVDLCDDFVPPG